MASCGQVEGSGGGDGRKLPIDVICELLSVKSYLSVSKLEYGY